MQKRRLAVGETVHMQDKAGGAVWERNLSAFLVSFSVFSRKKKNLKERNKERRRRKTHGGERVVAGSVPRKYDTTFVPGGHRGWERWGRR